MHLVEGILEEHPVRDKHLVEDIDLVEGIDLEEDDLEEDNLEEDKHLVVDNRQEVVLELEHLGEDIHLLGEFLGKKKGKEKARREVKEMEQVEG
jgi:hypothetical protein